MFEALILKLKEIHEKYLFHLIFHVYVCMIHSPYLCYIINGLIKMLTDCSVDVILTRLAAQLYYLEFKNIYGKIFLYGF